LSPDDKSPCNPCVQGEVEKRLEAEENARTSDRELLKLKQQHAEALDSAEDAAVTELQKARWEAEFGLTKQFHEKIAELAGGSIERSRDSAKYVQTAAAWIATLYTGLLALVFSVTENPLPLRGVYAAGFLGLAVALAAAYLAFIGNPGKLRMYEGGASLTEQQMNRTGFLVKWINASVRDRRWAIRASVVCLAIGVAFIPVAFVADSKPAPVPDLPAAPTIPGTIAEQVGTPAAELFEAQLGGYEAAIEARNEAIEKGPAERERIAADEHRTNQIALWCAIAGLLLAFFGPLLYGRIADGRDDEDKSPALDTTGETRTKNPVGPPRPAGQPEPS
jgi:hypothetical protein